MIVLIDPEQGVVTVCDKTVVEYNIGDIEGIRRAIAGQEVYYITSAKVVSGNEVLSLLSGVPMSEVYSAPKRKSTNRYLHSARNSRIILKGGNHPYILKGISDFRLLEKVPEEVINGERYEKFMRIGKIEIVDEDKKAEIIKMSQQNSMRFQKLNAEKETRVSVIEDSNSGSAERFSPFSDDAEDSDEIAISTEESFNKTSEQEVFKNLKDIGIDLD